MTSIRISGEAIAIRDYDPRDDLELQMCQGQRLTLLTEERNKDGQTFWYTAKNTQGHTGRIPAKLVRVTMTGPDPEIYFRWKRVHDELMAKGGITYTAWESKMAVPSGFVKCTSLGCRHSGSPPVSSNDMANDGTFDELPRSLGACVHDVELLLRSDPGYGRDFLRTLRVLWYPDRFAQKCAPHSRRQLETIATEMFQILDTLYDGEKTPEAEDGALRESSTPSQRPSESTASTACWLEQERATKRKDSMHSPDLRSSGRSWQPTPPTASNSPTPPNIDSESGRSKSSPSSGPIGMDEACSDVSWADEESCEPIYDSDTEGNSAPIGSLTASETLEQQRNLTAEDFQRQIQLNHAEGKARVKGLFGRDANLDHTAQCSLENQSNLIHAEDLYGKHTREEFETISRILGYVKAQKAKAMDILRRSTASDRDSTTAQCGASPKKLSFRQGAYKLSPTTDILAWRITEGEEFESPLQPEDDELVVDTTTLTLKKDKERQVLEEERPGATKAKDVVQSIDESENEPIKEKTRLSLPTTAAEPEEAEQITPSAKFIGAGKIQVKDPEHEKVLEEPIGQSPIAKQKSTVSDAQTGGLELSKWAKSTEAPPRRNVNQDEAQLCDQQQVTPPMPARVQEITHEVAWPDWSPQVPLKVVIDSDDEDYFG